MKNILVIGAGRSATSLIDYLLNYIKNHEVRLTVADASLDLAKSKIKAESEKVKAIELDIFNNEALSEAVSQANIVVSMVPASFHAVVAKQCIQHECHMVSASYQSPEIMGMHQQAKEKGITILKECGLDPGIDHMTAMEVIDHIKDSGGEITSFKSFTGGLIAPESDNNPWHYKFTWNPRNVVLAGQGIARYLENGQFKYVPYHQLFSRTQPITVEGFGAFEGYANRDSLGYRDIYSLQEIPTLIRGTLRKPPYCSAWQHLVSLGMTDDTYQMDDIKNWSWRDYTNAFLPYDAEHTVEDKVIRILGIQAEGEDFYLLKWLGLFSDDKIGLATGSPAQVLQHLLEQKWSLEEGDKDMVVMQHIFDYNHQGTHKRITSSLVSLGDDSLRTAMAKTVGWPLAIATRLLLEGKITQRGVCLPVSKHFYQPILEELRTMGIAFTEKEETL